MSTELQRWARAEIDWPLAGSAEMTNTEIREWIDREWMSVARGLNAARLETVRVLREQCYSALSTGNLIGSSGIDVAAEAILDTPVDELAGMVVMSDTVMGNWRTIAATVTQR